MKKILYPLIGISLCLTTSACLKTRAQLKQDQDDNAPAKPVPAQVQDVQPQGQYVIDELKNEITRLNGRVEDLERTQKQGPAGGIVSKEDLQKLEGRVTDLEKAQAAMIESMKKMEQSAPPPDPTEYFEKGKAAYDIKNYDSAIENLSTYLKNPRAKRTEDATFLRGEAFYFSKQYKKAIIDYSKFTDKYTNSSYVPSALYRIGLSFDALGMPSDAKGFYQELVEKFPKSKEAKKARAKLK